jgi:UDP-N-acetylmuramyl pentapeptide phosphotransferase/UDP-N-acetylglucosamine-1-phosphate transferase
MQRFLLQTNFHFIDFKFSLFAFATAFIVAMLVMPLLITIINRYQLFDVPDTRKEHRLPVPTMGGIACCVGMTIACLLWFRFTRDLFIISFFLSVAVLFAVGILDDLKNIPARYKLVIQMLVAGSIAFSGLRITSFNGLFGIHELSLPAQYSITLLAITGITNAYNLIDGIDGLAGGLGFMSLVTLGLFLTLCKDSNTAVIAFALSGGLLGFLYYNFTPARIFMGDTGSLVLGFVVAVLCVRLMQLNAGTNPYVFLPHAPVFAMSIVAIPVFDTMRVFTLRIWRGRSPFSPDKNHIHHLLTNNGWSHNFAAKLICFVHAVVLAMGYFLKDVSQVGGMIILAVFMLLTVAIFQRMRVPDQAPSIPADSSSV